jgi:hypothetical protein
MLGFDSNNTTIQIKLLDEQKVQVKLQFGYKY